VAAKLHDVMSVVMCLGHGVSMPCAGTLLGNGWKTNRSDSNYVMLLRKESRVTDLAWACCLLTCACIPWLWEENRCEASIHPKENLKRHGMPRQHP
jgi:hypothetical protein